MNAESLMHERGNVAVIAHKNQFTREEKDALRNSDLVFATGDHYVLPIVEEIEFNDALALAAYEEFEDDGRTPITEVAPGGEPTMADLKALTVSRLQELADKEEVDLTGLKLKDDILGRMAAHFGLDPAS
jgi:hypothetical protein